MFEQYGFGAEDEETLRRLRMQRMWQAIAANATSLHEGNIGRDISSAVSMDQVAQQLYQQRQREAQIAKQDEYREFQMGRAKESDARSAADRARKLKAEYDAMVQAESDREAEIANTNASAQQKAEDAAYGRIEFDQLSPSEDLQIRAKHDPEGALEEARKRKYKADNPKEEVEVNWQTKTLPDGSIIEWHPRTREQRVLAGPKSKEESGWDYPYTKRSYEAELNRIRNDPFTGELPLEEVVSRARRNLSVLYGGPEPVETSPLIQSMAEDAAAVGDRDKARALMTEAGLDPDDIERALEIAYQ